MSPRAKNQASPTVSATVRRSPYERIKQAVLTGELQPGEPLVETVLAHRYEVSRTPIREALTRLEQDGLVQRTDRGLVVRERSPEEILDIYETRIVLEGTAAKVAAERRSQIDVIVLKRVAGKLEAMKPGEDYEMATANREFHRAVWQATHNNPLIDLLGRLDLHLARYPATTLSQPGRWERGNREHRSLVEAIERQDADAAEQIATAHFTEARDLRLTLWADSQS